MAIFYIVFFIDIDAKGLCFNEILFLQKSQDSGVVNKEAERLDKGSLNGLRGLFAFHIMAYHACLGIPFVVHVEPVVYLYANVDMPLFFLLSGFSLALGCGKTT